MTSARSAGCGPAPGTPWTGSPCPGRGGPSRTPAASAPTCDAPGAARRPPPPAPPGSATDGHAPYGCGPPGPADPRPGNDQPGMHALTAYSIPSGDLGHRNPGQHFQHGPVSLLGHAQLPQHERSVKHQAEPMCKASSGTAHVLRAVGASVRTFCDGLEGGPPGPLAPPDARPPPALPRRSARGANAGPTEREGAKLLDGR